MRFNPLRSFVANNLPCSSAIPTNLMDGFAEIILSL
jgi:hypothetical protein